MQFLYNFIQNIVFLTHEGNDQYKNKMIFTKNIYSRSLSLK